MNFESAFAELPIIAILRGVTPDEVEAVAEALHRAGVRIVEVPLNSPKPLASIARLSRAFPEAVVRGAGTVRTTAEVDAVAAAGGRIIVSPHTDTTVIRNTLKRGLIPVPGFSTPTEAFAAIDAGARRLKLFPASTHGPGHVSALRAVLPPEIKIIAVGGVGPADMEAWWAAGARGFGLGSDLYKPGRSADEVFARASAAVSALRALAKGCG
jgi:2-dehydro-3-deoxyphosphogalactonate aldolase